VSTPTTARRAQEIALDRIEVGGNVRELDAEHVTALAGSMAVRGLIVPSRSARSTATGTRWSPASTAWRPPASWAGRRSPR
jgi:hypothetical protein